MQGKLMWGGVLVAGMVIGCGSSGTRAGQAPGDDGGTTPPPDGGAGADAGRDAGPDDAAPDASNRGPATVTVFEFGSTFGQPQAGVSAMFHSGDGHLIASLVTDSAGKATAQIPPDAMVTIIRQFGPDDTQLLTQTNVQPGAALEFGPRTGLPRALATMTVTWTKPPLSFVGHFDVVTPCGGAFAAFNDRAATFAISEQCAGTTFPVYVIARDNGEFLDQSGVENQTAVDGSTIPLTTWLGPTLVTSDATNVPANVFVGGQIEQAAHGLVFDGDIAGFPFPGDGQLTYHVAPSPGSELREQIDLSCFIGGALDQVIVRRKPFGSQFSLDVGAAMLPGFTSAGFDLRTRAWSWSTAAPVNPDVQLLYLSYQRAGNQRFAWSVIASSAIGSSFALPEIPAELARLTPLATDRLNGAVSLVRLGNGLTFSQVQADVSQWLSTGFPDNTPPINWATAPAALDLLTKTNALF